MNSIWTAVIAVIGTLGGVGLTQWFAARERAAAFRREWLRTEASHRIELYNDILSKMHGVSVCFLDALSNTDEGSEPAPAVAEKLIHNVEAAVDALNGTIRSKAVLCSQEMMTLYDQMIESVGGVIASKEPDRTLIEAVQEELRRHRRLIEKQAQNEVSSEALLARL